MTVRKFVYLVGLSAMAVIGAELRVSAQVSQVQAGRLYAFHTPAVGACPGLDWHVVVNANKSLTGMVAWDGMQHTAVITGIISSDNTFRATAKAADGATASITGKVAVGQASLTIGGTGGPCDNKTIRAPRAPDAASVGGGG